MQVQMPIKGPTHEDQGWIEMHTNTKGKGIYLNKFANNNIEET